MQELYGIRATIKRSLDSEEAAREKAFGLSRKLIKSCREAISKMVQGKRVDMDSLVSLSLELGEIDNEGRWGFVEDARTELAEAAILDAVVRDRELPLPGEVALSERAYALGICDAVGEIRRIVLELNISGKTPEAMGYLRRMRELFSVIDGLTYPSGMIQLKRKQDSARAQLERTLGEMTTSTSLYKGQRGQQDE